MEVPPLTETLMTSLGDPLWPGLGLEEVVVIEAVARLKKRVEAGWFHQSFYGS